MVWRRALIVCLTVCLLMSVAMQAHADTVYPDGNINTSYLQYFKDVSPKIGINDDYVFYRSGQYEYKLITGELDYDGGYFFGSNVKSLTLSLTNAYSSSYIWTSEALTSWDLTTSGYMVYSNLGDYPELIERGDYLATASIILLVIGFFAFYLRSIFVYSLRG